MRDKNYLHVLNNYLGHNSISFTVRFYCFLLLFPQHIIPKKEQFKMTLVLVHLLKTVIKAKIWQTGTNFTKRS